MKPQVTDEAANKFFGDMNWAVCSYAERNLGIRPLGGLYLYRGRPTLEEIVNEWLPQNHRMFELVKDVMADGPCVVDTFVVKTTNTARICIERGEPSEEFEFKVEWVNYP